MNRLLDAHAGLPSLFSTVMRERMQERGRGIKGVFKVEQGVSQRSRFRGKTFKLEQLKRRSC